jgi:RNA polymerase sigma factor (sigma-70 family)
MVEEAVSTRLFSEEFLFVCWCRGSIEEGTRAFGEVNRMTHGATGHLLRQLRQMVGAQAADDLTDRQLLERFVQRRDETAFAVLVRRHGPMVLGVCQRVLRDPHDVEDAFQATFLVLVRKASSLRQPELVGQWLHGVAYRVALNARAAAKRRRLHEREVAAMPAVTAAPALEWQELRAVLDETLQELPAKYRALLLLCDVEGRTHEQAAQALGCPVGSMSWRLGRARALLRERLTQRGIMLSTSVLAVILPEKAAVAVPVFLATATVQAGLVFAAGKAATAGVISASAATLAEGVLQAMFLTKVKIGVVLLLAVSLLGLGAGAVTHQALAQKPGPTNEKAAPAAPRATAKEDPKADGEPRELSVLQGHTNGVTSVALSADGRILISSSFDKTVRVWDARAGKQRARLRGHESPVKFVVITPDSKSVVTADQGGAFKVWDLSTGKERTTLTRADRHPAFLFLTADGRTLTAVYDPDRVHGIVTPSHKPGQVKQWDLPSAREVAAVEHGRNAYGAVVSPNGKALAWGEWVPQPATTTVRIWDLPSGRERTAWIQDYPESKPLAFSPDGKTLFILDSRADTIQLWEMATGKPRFSMRNVRLSYLHAVVALHPSGRIMASADKEGGGAVRVWDVATGVPWADLKVNNDEITALVFSADGNTLAAAEGPDTAIRVWDTSGFWRARPPLKEKLSDGDLASLWADLAGDDAAKAYRAIWSVAGAPRQAVPWIGRRLRPVTEADAQRTAALIADLDSDRFAVRKKAGDELEKLAELARPALAKALAGQATLELRRRLEQLLARLDGPITAPEQLRTLRAIEVLEHIGTPEARQVLDTLARGAAVARVTQEAKASLKRLAQQTGRP